MITLSPICPRLVPGLLACSRTQATQPEGPHFCEHGWSTVLGKTGSVLDARFPAPTAQVDTSLSNQGDYMFNKASLLLDAVQMPREGLVPCRLLQVVVCMRCPTTSSSCLEHSILGKLLEHLVSIAGQSVYGTLRAGWRKQPKLGRQSRPLSMLQRHSERAFRGRRSLVRAAGRRSLTGRSCSLQDACFCTARWGGGDLADTEDSLGEAQAVHSELGRLRCSSLTPATAGRDMVPASYPWCLRPCKLRDVGTCASCPKLRQRGRKT